MATSAVDRITSEIDTRNFSHIFIFDHMRGHSLLFNRWLSTSPEVYSIWQPFIQTAVLGADRFTAHTRNSEQRTQENEEKMLPFYGDHTFESCRQKLTENVADAEKEGKHGIISEHWMNTIKHGPLLDFVRRKDFSENDLSSNPMELPEELFNTMMPAILIRNPLAMTSENYHGLIKMTQIRPGDEDFEITTTMEFCRLLFDYFRGQGRQVIVVDADDMFNRNKQLKIGLGRILRIDPEGIKDTWEPMPQEQWPTNPALLGWTKSILESSGLPPADSLEEPEFDEEYKKWVALLGDEHASNIKKVVEANMPHYEYLKQFKI